VSLCIVTATVRVVLHTFERNDECNVS